MLLVDLLWCVVIRLISYGFHSNLPKASDLLSPTAWLQMLVGIINMPKYDPMALVLDSKAVMGFNLSFFADEVCGKIFSILFC